jgi:hypothetical protein
MINESFVSRKHSTFSLLITPFEVNTSRPSHGISHKSFDVGSDFFIGFEVVFGKLKEFCKVMEHCEGVCGESPNVCFYTPLDRV